MVSLLALALFAADPAVQVQGNPARAHIEGETDSFLWIETREELKLKVTGPGRLVLDLRGWAKHAVPHVAPVFFVTVDGAPTHVPAIRKAANRKVEAPGGYASTSTLVPVQLKPGKHLVKIREGHGSPGLVSTTFIPEETGGDFFMPKAAAPDAQPEVAATPEIPQQPVQPQQPEESPAPIVPAQPTTEMAGLDLSQAASAPSPWRLEAAVGGASQVQLGGLGPALGVAGEYQREQLSVGLSLDYLRVPLEVIQPLSPLEGDTKVTGAASSLPVLVRGTYRPIEGSAQPFVGLGAGLTFASVSLGGSKASKVLPAGELRGGVDIEAGPGQVVLQARLLAAQGDFEGVAKHFQAGGFAAQAGYRFAL